MSLPNVERFVALIRERTGNVVPLARRGFLGEVLARRARAAELAVPEYVDRLADAALSGEAAEEWDTLIPMVTIKESYFFRAPQQFAALERQILPRLVKARSEERRIRVWSAACARGEEPGTLAILLAESRLLRGWEWEIVATDVDEEALETARRGLYGERAVARVPTAQRERWFRSRGKLYELAPELRRRIRYRPLNLARPPYRGLLGGREKGKVGPAASFDLVFLRNVLIYFPRPLQRRVVATVADSLAEDGALFLGASETLWQIQRRLAAYDLGNCFCYRHRQEGDEEGTLSSFGPVEVPEELEERVISPPPDGSVVRREPPGVSDVPWLDFRGAGKATTPGVPASSEAEAETESREQPPQPSPEPSSEPVGEDDKLLAAISGEGLVEALEAQEDDEDSHLHAEPCGIQERLLAVAGRLEAGELEPAARDLEAVLEADPSEPAAHALDGFLHDLRQEPEEAIQSYRAALYLDPALYQVRLLLADCMKRHGWDRRAAHEYREVLAALATGRDRLLVPFDPLPVPDREGAERRCRRALAGS